MSLVLQNVIAMHAGKVLYSTWRWIQDKFYKSKSSSRFPNFDASNAWQMGHNSRQGYFLEQELLLDFAAWIDLTSNAHNLLISVEFEVTEHILLLQNVLTTYGLSRLYDASQPPGKLQGTFYNNA